MGADQSHTFESGGTYLRRVPAGRYFLRNVILTYANSITYPLPEPTDPTAIIEVVAQRINYAGDWTAAEYRRNSTIGWILDVEFEADTLNYMRGELPDIFRKYPVVVTRRGDRPFEANPSGPPIDVGTSGASESQ